MEKHNMDLLQSLEIYIPVDAEVKSISLCSLPGSVLRRMGLPLGDGEDSGTLSEPPEGIWISPVVLRRKGQKHTTPTGSGIVENVIGRRFKASQSPYRMSFFSSSKAAYKVLKETMPGSQVSVHTSPISRSATASAPPTSQDAVVLYQGRLYLSIRRPNRSQRATREPQPVPRASDASTSEGTSKIQKELLNDDNRKKNRSTWKTTHRGNRTDVTHEEEDVSSSTAECSASKSADAVHRRRRSDARGDQVAEQAEGQEEVIDNHMEVEVEESGDEDAESSHQNKSRDRNAKTVRGETVAVVKQSHNQSWARRAPLGAASSTLQQTVDFGELEQEEMIARMKAKLRQSEAALNSLSSS